MSTGTTFRWTLALWGLACLVAALFIPTYDFAFDGVKIWIYLCALLLIVMLAVMVLYPVLMVWPQELIFRTFFFHRYRTLFKRSGRMIVVSSLNFGVAHLFYGNWVAPALSLVGGLLFGWRYQASRSLPLVSLEHALWGDYLFTTSTRGPVPFLGHG